MSVRRPTAGWLKAVRQACNRTVASASERLGISRQAYSQIERREAARTISIESLTKGANALDCDLFYFVLPRKEIADTFSALAEKNDPKAANLRASEHSMMLEGQGVSERVDGKNIGLAKQLYWLRQNLSLYEIISVNAGKIKEVGASDALFGHLQRLALEAIVLTLCKVYEREKTNDLYSIDGVIGALATTSFNETQCRAAERFAARHGIHRECNDPKTFFRSVLGSFITGHADAFVELKRFRDKFAVHSEHGYELETLPSFELFDTFYQFAYDFYFLVSDQVIGVGPSLMSLHVGSGLSRLLQKIGISNPTPGFPFHDRGK
jgi:predicted DNA-binding mobile mystery protein A